MLWINESKTKSLRAKRKQWFVSRIRIYILENFLTFSCCLIRDVQASTQACKFRVTQTLLSTSVGRVGKSFDTRKRRSFWLIASLDHNKAFCFCFEPRKVRNRAYSFLLSCWWTDWTWMKSCTAYPPHAGEKSDRVPGRLAQNQTLSRGRTKYRDFVIFHHGYLQYCSCAFSSVPTNSVGEWKFCKWYLH